MPNSLAFSVRTSPFASVSSPVDRLAPFGVGYVLLELGEVLVGAECRLPNVDPPALAQAADVQGVEAELDVKVGNQLLSLRVVARQGESSAPGVAFGVTIFGHISGADHVESSHDPALGEVGLQKT